MTIKYKSLLALSLALVIVLAGCGLSSEPEIAQEIALPTSAPELTAPQAPPDLVGGAAFYIEHCATCHGAGGQGDGEMVRDGRLQAQPPDFTDPATMQGKTPIDYMRAITDGNVLAGMPPFARYTTQERWNVAAYVYSGALTGAVLEQGAAIYAAQCESCHGPQGAGDGPEAPAIMPDLTDPAAWAEASNDAIYQKISVGVMPGMPSFADDLGEQEIQAVVGYVRTLTMTGTPGFPLSSGETIAEAVEETPAVTEAVSGQAEATAQPEAAVTEEAVPQPEFITITGRVTNGTAGGAIPEGEPLTLHMFDPPNFTETSLQADLAGDGTYTFTDVPHLADRAYLLSIQNDGVFFSSQVYQLDDPSNPVLDTEVVIYDRTNDPSVLQFTMGVMQIRFSQFGMQIAEVLTINNNSDRVFLTDELINDTQRVALRVPLPPGAAGVAFEPGAQDRRFFLTEDGTAVLDAQPVRPGEGDIFFSYLIPYQDGAIIEQEILYPFVGSFHLLIEAGQVQLTGGGFTMEQQPVTMGSQSYEAYVATLDLSAGDAISYTLTGMPDAVAAAQQATQSSSKGSIPTAVLVLLVVGILFIGAGGFMFLLRQEPADPVKKAIDDLLEQIADLDDQHEQGALNHDYYQQMRAKLKAELAELMRDDRE